MQLVEIKLQSLLRWVDLNVQDIDSYILNYPYNDFRLANVIYSLKTSIDRIIDMIMGEICRRQYTKIDYIRNAPRAVTNISDITLLSQIKNELEEMKYSLLVANYKKYSVDKIRAKLRNLIAIASADKRKSSYDIARQINNQRNSFDLGPRNVQNYRSKSPRMRDNYTNQIKKNKQTEQERSLRLKRQIYYQMNNQLKTNRNFINQKPRNRIYSEQQEIYSRKYSKPLIEYYPSQRMQIPGYRNDKQLRDKYKRQTQRYNYIKNYESHQYLQKDPNYKKNQSQSDSPYRDNYKFLPSTSSKTEKNIKDINTVEQQNQQIAAHQNLEDVKTKLNFEGPPQNQNKTEQNQSKVQIFLQDSIEEHENNISEDSLQLMRAQENHLNQTGRFVMTQPSQQHEQLLYSFCRQ